MWKKSFWNLRSASAFPDLQQARRSPTPVRIWKKLCRSSGDIRDIKDKNFELDEEEYQELDKLATLLLDPNKNFKKLQNLWNKEVKFRIRKGALN